MKKPFLDKPRYFEIQYLNSKESIVPFIKDHYTPEQRGKILEIGSAEGGVLKAFTELSCQCLGIELSPSRVVLANQFMEEDVSKGLVSFINKDIYDINISELPDKFDLIILKDVIEHIHNQERFMKRVGDFLAENGFIFFGFPSWRMPFGGHQQIAKSKLLSNLPYFHLLPTAVYKFILRLFAEDPSIIRGLLDIKKTGISTRRFEKICRENNFEIVKRTKYLIAPIYEYKFGYKTKLLPSWIASIPYFNDFFTFQSYYLVRKKKG